MLLDSACRNSRWRVHDHEFGGMSDPAAEEPAKLIGTRDAVEIMVTDKRVGVAVP